MSHVEEPGGIAVIGLAGRFPKARNIDAFWQNLRNGVEAISFFSDEELRDAGVRIPDDSNYVKARGVLDDAELFDAAFFGINPREAEITDPQHRIFSAERMCYLSSLEGWLSLHAAGALASLADRFLVHLGKDSLFELC